MLAVQQNLLMSRESAGVTSKAAFGVDGKTKRMSQTTDASLHPRRHTMGSLEHRLSSLAQSRVFWVALALLVGCLWIPRLLKSFWIDEAGSFWMAHEGPLTAIQKTWHWPGQSLLYAAIASLFALDHGPLREFLLRIPTLAGIAAAAYFVFRLAEAGLGRNAGIVAGIIFLFHPLTVDLGTQARPYGLAMGAVAASCCAIFQWVETRQRTWLLTYVVSSVLVVHLHYFFAIVFVAHAAYLLYVLAVERRFERWKELVVGVITIGVLILPLFPHARLLVQERNTLPFMPAPSFTELAESLASSVVVLGALSAALLLQFVLPNSLKQPQALRRSFFVLLFCWWVIAPVLFFAASTATPMKVFVPRYIASSVPAQALVLAYGGYSIFGGVTGRLWALIAVLLTSASPAAIRKAYKTGTEELMPFMRIIQAESTSQVPPPVLFCSQLPESNFYNWRAGLRSDSYLYTAFVAYPMKNRLVPLPASLSDDAKRYVEQELQTDLAHVPEILFVDHEEFGFKTTWNDWMIARMKQAGFEAAIQKPNSYWVIIFRRPPR
jgi:hypothetical protein